jgi:hypothetical protein
MLHDEPPGEDDPELAAWDMLVEMTREAEKSLGHSLAPELEGLAIRGMLVQASPLSSGMNSTLQSQSMESANESHSSCNDDVTISCSYCSHRCFRGVCSTTCAL